MLYKNLTKDELQQELKDSRLVFDNIVKEKWNIDISRGKPCKEQLELSNEIFEIISKVGLPEAGVDMRNYGGIEGIAGMRELFAEMLGVKPANVIVGGNSSLNMMFDTIARCMQFGVLGAKPWNQYNKIKFLCPVPGYDRHFGICELFGIEMVAIPMNEDGPIMDIVEEYVAHDETVKGIWCVPKYSNPTGITYSDEVVERLSKMSTKAEDFRIFWDNAYAVHDLYEESDNLKNIYQSCSEYGNTNRVYIFSSTSKITFPGSGVACFASSEANIKDAVKVIKYQTIGPDKVNQYAHYLFLKDMNGVREQMRKHADIIRPKFETVINALEQVFGDSDIASWNKPNGGYFISYDVLDGCAKRVGALCKEAGLVITEAGATYPLGIDDRDKNIRIAPTFTKTEELDTACRILICATKIACIEKLLADK